MKSRVNGSEARNQSFATSFDFWTRVLGAVPRTWMRDSTKLSTFSAVKFSASTAGIVFQTLEELARSVLCSVSMARANFSSVRSLSLLEGIVGVCTVGMWMDPQSNGWPRVRTRPRSLKPHVGHGFDIAALIGFIGIGRISFSAMLCSYLGVNLRGGADRHALSSQCQTSSSLS